MMGELQLFFSRIILAELVILVFLLAESCVGFGFKLICKTLIFQTLVCSIIMAIMKVNFLEKKKNKTRKSSFIRD